MRELYPLKPWGRSKAADLARLKTVFGHDAVANLTHERLMTAFAEMHDGGAGGVTISARAGYLVAMRISETCRLEWDDLNEADKTIRIRDRKHPSAKIGNHQIVPLLKLAGQTHSS